jgi:hypothetical protein
MISPRGFCAGGIGGIGTPRAIGFEGGDEGGALVTGEAGGLGDLDGGCERIAPADLRDPFED